MTDFEIFQNHFLIDIPSDKIGFIMYYATGRPFYFNGYKQLKRQLVKVSEYASLKGILFDAEIVFDELMRVEKC